jgi:hypothetical protein
LVKVNAESFAQSHSEELNLGNHGGWGAEAGCPFACEVPSHWESMQVGDRGSTSPLQTCSTAFSAGEDLW